MEGAAAARLGRMRDAAWLRAGAEGAREGELGSARMGDPWRMKGAAAALPRMQSGCGRMRAAERASRDVWTPTLLT
jgi:hypothetical protein